MKETQEGTMVKETRLQSILDNLCDKRRGLASINISLSNSLGRISGGIDTSDPKSETKEGGSLLERIENEVHHLGKLLNELDELKSSLESIG